MIWVNLKRILKTGFISFWRNTFVSLSAVLVMIITLFVISFIIFSSALLSQAREIIENQVDINVNFVSDAPESEILEIKEQLEALSEVQSVEYLTKEQVLANFREIHQDDQLYLEGLNEIGENPFGATLNIRAKEPSEYEGVANFLNQNYSPDNSGTIVRELSFNENREAIERLNVIIDSGKRLSVIVAIVFIAISIVISLNTIRLAMYISRNEISVMQLVGASRGYVSGPFVVAGAMYGIVSAIVTLFLLWPFTYWLAKPTSDFFNLNIFNYYINNFVQMFLIIFFSGILIGAISSYFAIKRYLRNSTVVK